MLTKFEKTSKSTPHLTLQSAKFLYTPEVSVLHEGQISLTHGFMPHTPMMDALPEPFAAWDTFDLELPNYLENGSEREEIQKLPLLNADDLPDVYLSRAAAILGNAAHAYYFNQRYGKEQTCDPLPTNIREPWEKINQRIGRALPSYEPGKLKASRSHYDTFLCNWKIVNPDLILDGENNVHVTLDDLELRHSVFNTRDEKVFNRTLILMEMRFAPALHHMMLALTAINKQDDEALIEALRQIAYVIDKTAEALSYINPNQYSQYHVDQTIWARTVAKFDGTIPGGLPGLGAGLLPMFHTLDCFMERFDYNTELGEDMQKKLAIQPKPIANFLTAMRQDLAQSSLRKYVERSNHRELKAQYQSFVDAYVGRDGLLDAHALKAYGYLKLTFRAGRLETTGGNTGSSSVRAEPQRKLYRAFVAAEKERLQGYRPYPQFATRIETKSVSNKAAIIELDPRTAGMDFLPGDRCAVFPINSETEINALLMELQANPEQEIPLSDEWQNYLATQWNIQVVSLSLFELLHYADLYELRKTVQDNLELTSQQLQPLKSRLYSVSPMMNKGKEKLCLTVGKQTYQDKGLVHEGVASSHLMESSADVRIQKLSTIQFHLPKHNSAPVIMFAAGTGISPFLGFIDARKAMKDSGQNWLFYSVATRDVLLHQKKLEKAAAAGKLDLSIILTREELNRGAFNKSDNSLQFYSHGSAKHIDTLIRENTEELLDLITRKGAHIYICGGSGFADTVNTAIDDVLKMAIPNEQRRALYIRTLIADKRYNSDVFTPAAQVQVDTSRQTQKPLYRSEIFAHNTMTDSWCILNGKVYDLSKYMHVHPGGRKIIQSIAGLDGSDDYNQIGHGSAPQVEALLAQYYLGHVLVPVFKEACNQALYNSAVGLLESIVEMENTLSNNTEIFDKNHSAVLWRDVFGVFAQSNLPLYPPQDSDDTHHLGAMLAALGEKLNYPTNLLLASYSQLAKAAQECGLNIRQTSLDQLSDSKREELRKMVNALVKHTFTFLQTIKTQIIAIMHDTETLGDEYILDILKHQMQGIETQVNAFLFVINRTNEGINTWSAMATSDRISRSVKVSACPFAFTSTMGTCPYGYGKGSEKPTAGTKEPFTEGVLDVTTTSTLPSLGLFKKTATNTVTQTNGVTHKQMGSGPDESTHNFVG